jgi:hypothetical protein
MTKMHPRFEEALHRNNRHIHSCFPFPQAALPPESIPLSHHGNPATEILFHYTTPAKNVNYPIECGGMSVLLRLEGEEGGRNE